jgi:hypothetical protein
MDPARLQSILASYGSRSRLLTYFRLRYAGSPPRAAMDFRALTPQRRQGHAGPDIVYEGEILDLLVQ